MRKLTVLLFFIAIANAAWAQDVSPRNFDRQKWKEIVGDETYQENKMDLTPPRQREFKGWSLPGGPGGGLVKLISYIAVGIIFAFILYYLAKNVSVKQKVKSIKPLDITAPVENIEEIDTDALLRDALAGGDLRLAVRVHYLLLLKKLNEVGLIIWKKDKTNRDYLTELYGRETVYDDIRKLTLTYELVWYGERSVSNESFQRIRGDFETVNMNVVNVKVAE
ncbi:MAG TPA: DUF4129 domain-containing protein [Cyclobacteriaceae bacterium]|nr:DUF4129 domain-containing protein [Cyclobacteriaceae bacterium]